MLSRDEAFEELKIRLSDVCILRNSIAVEAIMREFARYFNADADVWGLLGLMHDIDYERTINTPSKHGLIGADILESLGIDESILYSVRAHNDYTSIPRNRKMDKMLYVADAISDMILKCVSTIPSKSVFDLSTEYIHNKLNEKEFKDVFSINKIRCLYELGLTLEEFIDIALRAVQEASKECIEINVEGN